MPRKNLVDVEELRRTLSYDPKSGIFRWLISTSNRVKVGDIAGYVNPQGRRFIRHNGKLFAASMLAWVYVTGKNTNKLIDHKSGDCGDDRFENLRVATYSENAANSKIHNKNKSGFKGVHLHKKSGKYRAQIRVGKNRIHLGLFKTKEAAHLAYVEAAKKNFGQYANNGRVK